MADDLSQRRPQDSSRISTSEEWEVRYWTKTLGVSEEELRPLVRSMAIQPPRSGRRSPGSTQKLARAMTAVIRMQLPKDTLDMSETTALVYSRDSTIFTGWKLTEPELRRQFEGADFAYFEAEATEAGDLRIVKRLPDQGWTGDVLIRRMRDPE